MSHCCERERDRDTERERIAAARAAIRDAELLIEVALVLLERKTAEERLCPTA